LFFPNANARGGAAFAALLSAAGPADNKQEREQTKARGSGSGKSREEGGL
jgi:hypothetical protein